MTGPARRPRYSFREYIRVEEASNYDRDEKLSHYQQISSLREVVLVDHATRTIEVSRRTERGFVLTRHGPGETVELECLRTTLAVDAIYGGSLA